MVFTVDALQREARLNMQETLVDYRFDYMYKMKLLALFSLKQIESYITADDVKTWFLRKT